MLLDTLNTQQVNAVTASDGPVLVLAGPGSGKTRVLTFRAAHLVLDRDIAPWRIMAVTFTNKAARQMRDRLDGLLGSERARRLTLGTFHATCARILRREAEAAGISPSYVIYDADDQLKLVKQALRELNLDEKRYAPRGVLGAISRAKNELVTPDTFRVRVYYAEVVKRVYERYQQLLNTYGGLDFDDLLMVTVRMFQSNSDVLATYQERYRHVLVDEFQDTNQAQYALISLLTSHHNNIFCVADEDQSIYAWRGADYRNIRRLRDDHPDLLTILLEQNYRSTQTILDVAQAVIRHNADRTDKVLFTERGAGPKISLHSAYDQDEEARFVVRTIQNLAAGGDALGDFAVMYRTNAQSRALEDAFMRAGLPYRLVGGTRFYSRREIKDLIAFLRLVHNPADRIGMERVINVPPRGVGQKSMAMLVREAGARRSSIHAVLCDLPDECTTRTRRALTAFTDMLEGWIAARDSLTVAQLIDTILEDTAYAGYLRDGTEEGEDRWANVLELRNVAAEYEELTFVEFLADVALVSDVDSLAEEVDAPTLLTLHSAKGLEYPVVFITGLEEGILPHSRSFDDPNQMAEERRLMYVGVTRAKDRLFLTHAFMRTRYGGSEASVRSSFLDDIPADMIRGKDGASNQRPSRRAPAPTRPAAASSTVEQQFRAGQRVRHARFGEGLVIESRVRGGEEIVAVAFESAGLKRLLVGLAPLKAIEG